MDTNSVILTQDLAHELRDALSPAAGALDLLRIQGQDPAARVAAADKIQRSLQRALATVDSFLLAAAAAEGALTLNLKRERMSVLARALSECLPEHLRGCWQLLEPLSEEEVAIDCPRASEAVGALVRYAYAIAEPGGAVTVRSSGREIRVRVRTLSGVAPSTEWFVPFRGRHSGDMALRTARELIRLQGGTVELAQPEAGTVEFVAGFAPGSTASTQVAGEQLTRRAHSAVNRVPTGQRSNHILIVDDSARVRAAYQEILEASGYTVSVAVSAEDAQRQLERARPDAVLIDIHLTGMNGFELARAIRARSGGAIQLVMLSGMTLDGTRRRLAEEAGFDACLDKMAGPIAVHELLRGTLDRTLTP
ncbi:MAG TPA: response regulator [Steroidobacteraceae bacterium]|jgi:CheY-like chemotaxis protein|nr:response regulator [Steroidobacteraceae bacterium]